MTMHQVQCCAPFSVAVSLGQVALNHQTMPVLHQGMAYEAKHRIRAERFLVKPCLRVSDRGVGRIRALLALEVDCGVTVAAVRVGHRFSLGLGLGGLIIGGGVMGGRIVRLFIIGRRALHFR